jgi:hypothetical protein
MLSKWLSRPNCTTSMPLHHHEQCNCKKPHGPNPTRTTDHPTNPIANCSSTPRRHHQPIAKEPNNAMTNLVYMLIHDITGQIFTDQTGRFPITSNRGHAYIIIFYVYDANFISSVPIKNCTKEELLHAYQLAYEYLTCRGFKPVLHKMDNETSKDVGDFIKAQQTTLQYTPPNIHCTNSAKRAIRTWKNHFTAGIASLPKSFPIANWCCLTNQCNYTVNIATLLSKSSPIHLQSHGGLLFL